MSEVAIKERPILFGDAMVRAILDGRKTQTRRPVTRPKSINGPAGPTQPHSPDDWKQAVQLQADGTWTFWYPGGPGVKKFAQRAYPAGGGIRCPYGRPGDRLWVREAWQQVDGCYCYRATPETNYLAWNGWTWKPSIHMPREASRLTLEVTGVRVEQVQDISPFDAWAEGVQPIEWQANDEGYIAEFWELWDSVYAERGYGWDANPWVWVVEFRKVEP
jgi:hypothetical protein